MKRFSKEDDGKLKKKMSGCLDFESIWARFKDLSVFEDSHEVWRWTFKVS